MFTLAPIGPAWGAADGAKSIRKRPAASQTRHSEVRFPGKPDLTVTQLTVNPSTPRVSKDIITIRVTVKNRGTAQINDAHAPAIGTDHTYNNTYSQLPPVDYWIR